MKKFWLGLGLLLVAGTFGQAADLKFSEEKPLDSSPLPAALKSSGTSGADVHRLSFSIATGDCALGKVNAFDVVRINGLEMKGESGSPQLPMKLLVVTLPKNSNVTGVTIARGSYRDITNALSIAPMPQPLKIGRERTNSSLVRNSAVYDQDAFCPGKIVGFASAPDKTGTLVYVHLFPLQYNPKTGKTFLITSGEIEIAYTTTAETRSLGSGQTTKDGLNPECIIIYPAKYEAQAQALKAFHESMNGTIGTPVGTQLWTTEYISQLNYGGVGQPPLAPFPDGLCPQGGFTNATLPLRSAIAVNYNAPLAQKMLSFILDLADYTVGYDPGYVSNQFVQYIVILGGSQDVPPSYYAFSNPGGSLTSGGYDSWLPTDYFYACCSRTGLTSLVPSYGVGRMPLPDLDDPILTGTVASVSGFSAMTIATASDPGDLAGCTVVMTTGVCTGRCLDIATSSWSGGTLSLTFSVAVFASQSPYIISAGNALKIVDTRDELQSVIDKTIAWYNSATTSWSNWFNNVAVAGGDPFTSSLYQKMLYWGELMSIDLLNLDDPISEGGNGRAVLSAQNVTKFFHTDIGYDEAFVEADVAPLLQQGSDHGFVYLIGHGSGNEFFFDDGTGISADDLLSYGPTTDYQIPIVISLSCDNAAFDEDIMPYNYGPSFGQSVLLSPAGGLFYLGGLRTCYSLNSWSFTNGVLNHESALISDICDRIFKWYHRGSTGLLVFSDVFANAQKDYYLSNASSWGIDTFRVLAEFALLGDPALYIPTKTTVTADVNPTPNILALNPRPNSLPYNASDMPIYEAPYSGSNTGTITASSTVTDTGLATLEVKLVDPRWDETDEKTSKASGQNYSTTFYETDLGPSPTHNGPSVYIERVSNEDTTQRERRLYLEVVNEFVTDGDVLLVDDDERRGYIYNWDADYEFWYTQALEENGYVRADQAGTPKYKIWHVENVDGSNAAGEGRHGEITQEALNAYKSASKQVIWFTGDDFQTTFLTYDQEFMASFLSGTGRAFVTGQDIGVSLRYSSFYADVLKASYVEDNIRLYLLQGIVTDGLSQSLANINITGGDGANNQFYPSETDPQAGASNCLLYDKSGGPGPVKSSAGGALRYWNGQSNGPALVYFSFGFEGIDNLNGTVNGRAPVLQSVLNWLKSPTASGVFTATAGDTEDYLNWTRPAGQAGVLVMYRIGAYPTTAPTSGTTYSAGDTIGDGTVIYVGSGLTYTHTGLTNGTTYYYSAYSYTSAHSYASLGNANATPSGGGGGLPAPSNLTAGASQVGGVWQANLAWVRNSTDEDGFAIERKLALGGTYEEIARTVAGVVTYTDTPLDADTIYYYRVRAFRGASTYSAYSNEVYVQTAEMQPPTGLVAMAGVDNVMLSWRDNSSNELGFYIERKHPTPLVPLPSYERVATVGADVNTYTDTDLFSDGRAYYYRVQAYNATTVTDYSNEAWATPASFTGYPINLQALPGYNSATVTWTDNTSGETGYYIEVWNDRLPSDVTWPDSAFTLSASTWSESAYVVVGLNSHSYIRVAAMASDGSISLFATSKSTPSQRYVYVEPFLDVASGGGGGGGVVGPLAAGAAVLLRYLKRRRKK